jgi:adenine-specific DNA-methyltransferase
MSWPNQDTFGPRYEVLHPKTQKPVKVPDRGWRWKESTFDDASQRVGGKYLNVIDRHDGSYVCGSIWFAKDEKTQPSSIKYLDEVEYFLLRSILSTKSDGGVELEKLFDGKSYFSRPKSTSLIKTLISSMQCKKSEIILDFFAGSGTTAHSLMDLNREGDLNHQFICVQIDEITDKKSAAHKVGYKTIFDITKARIEKAAAKIKAETPEYAGDLGFRIYETVQLPEKYQDAAEELTEGLELFDVNKLDQSDRHNLMRTWGLQDNVPLTMDFIPLDLAGYTVYQAKHLLYFIEPNLTLDAVVKMLEQIDNNPEFKPTQLVVFGYLLESKIQREMSEAVKHYNNRKGIELTLDIRY